MVAASEVDHIVPHKGDRGLFFGKSNLQSLCKQCHSRKTVLEDGRFGSSEALPRGLAKREGTNVRVVCGPSVELSYSFAQRMTAYAVDSMVIELEHLIASIDRTPLYESTHERRRNGMVQRNRLLRDALVGRGGWTTVYVVVPGPSMHERRYWSAIAASLVVLSPPLDTCMSMLATDPHGAKERRAHDIHHWWSAYVLDPNDTVIQNQSTII